MQNSQPARAAAVMLGLIIGTSATSVLSDYLKNSTLPPLPVPENEDNATLPNLPDTLSLKLVMPEPNSETSGTQALAVLSIVSDEQASISPTFSIPSKWIVESPDLWFEAQHQILAYVASAVGERTPLEKCAQVKRLIDMSESNLNIFRESLSTLGM